MTFKKKILSIGTKNLLIVDSINQTESFYQLELNLTDEERKVVSLKNEKKRMEWYAVRYAIQSHSDIGKFTISHNRDGKPFFQNNLKKQLSISHSGNKIAVYLSDQDCGVDIQFYTDKIVRVKKKFVNEYELPFLKKDAYKKLHIIWSAKESIYKLISKKGISLKNDITIKPFEVSGNDFNITGKYFVDDQEKTVSLGVELLKNEVLVWTI